MLPLPIAIDLVLFTLKNAQNGEILARKAPSATVKNIAKSILDIFNSNVNIKTIGIREGEKMHETLIHWLLESYTFKPKAKCHD